MKKIKIALLLVFPLLISCSPARNHSPDHYSSSARMLIRLYRGPLDRLSAVRQGECPMYPSCSEYAAQAIKKHGPYLGWIMATERLMRCGRDEVEISKKILVKGKWKIYDPVENNDFWLGEKNSE